MAQLLAITESSFSRQVLASPLPIVVRFGTPQCTASRALNPLLKGLAGTFGEQLRFGTINVDSATSLVEMYHIEATPTLGVFEHGELVTRIVGFAPLGLLQLLCEQVLRGELSPEAIWCPVEAVFEDTVIVPLLQAWQLPFARQVQCALQAGGPNRSRIDILVYDSLQTTPLTLFENKRLIRSARELQSAASQARGYALALGLTSFVVAAPSGMWIYRLAGERTQCVKALSSLEVHQQPELLRQMLFPPSP